MGNDRSALDPVLILPLPDTVQSVCFVGSNKTCKGANVNASDLDDEDSDSSGEELTFRSSAHIQKRTMVHAKYKQDLFANRLIVSCHKNGEALLWDCARQSLLSTIVTRGSGLCVKRIPSQDNTFLYQTRDLKGTVSIHSLDTHLIVREYETYSQTFCQAAPSWDDPHLLALPSRQDSTATVVDDRDPVPVAVIPTSDHGMLTSLALCSGGSTGRPVLACGMESGSIFFRDFTSGSMSKASSSLAKDPILALDLAPSTQVAATDAANPSVVAIAGLAGDATELAELPVEEQGRVALIKASLSTNDSWNIRLRARLSTCRLSELSAGKPGVSICRFRPDDARLFAVGGWDHRVRLFERSKGRSMAILRGHQGSVNALDWAPDAIHSGLIATAGSDDNCVYFWQCFPKDS